MTKYHDKLRKIKYGKIINKGKKFNFSFLLTESGSLGLAVIDN